MYDERWVTLKSIDLNIFQSLNTKKYKNNCIVLVRHQDRESNRQKTCFVMNRCHSTECNNIKHRKNNGKTTIFNEFCGRFIYSS